MLEKFLDTIKDEKRIIPNKLTVALGNLIRNARVENNMSQAELAERTYFKQSSISKIEKGLRAITAEDLLYFSFALDKPIGYFFPPEIREGMGEDKLSVFEQELILYTRQLSDTDVRKLIAQARALVEFEE